MDHRALGTSLLAVLISMSLGMIVLFSAFTGYYLIKKQYVRQQRIQQVSHTVRTTFQLLTRDLHSSGYKGPRSRDPTFKLTRQMGERFGSGQLPDVILYPKDSRLVFGFYMYGHPMRAEGRDVLMIYNVPGVRHALAEDLRGPNDDIQIFGHSHIRKGALVLIADYLQGDLFIANDVGNQRVFHQSSSDNVSNAFSKSYRRVDHTEVVELQRIVYYLKKFNSADATYGLYRENVLLSGSAQELMRGITRLQIKYGLCQPASKTIDYHAAERIQGVNLESDWPRVVSVRIRMAVLNEHTKQEESFETEIALRNTPIRP